MVHTEPFFSRKDDVPERRREFAGKVFRIPHKDDLQVRRVRNGSLVCVSRGTDTGRAEALCKD